jgi:hypothetical protein
MTLLAGLLAGSPGGRRARLAALALALVGGTIVMRRRGYGVGANTVVRCHGGHLFTTIWIPAASVKSLRLGWWRFQRCPVGRHWTLVHPVREADLSEGERQDARGVRDIRIP